MTVERSDIELREVKLLAGDAMEFSGYGAVFGNVDSHGDVIVRGAFSETLSIAKKSNRWPAMLLQHGGMGFSPEGMTPIGIWTSLEEDDYGLKVTGKLADTPRGREAYALLKMDPRPAIDSLSIGFRIKEFELRTRPEDPRRKLKKVDLLEISLVTFASNPKAKISDVKLDPRTLESALRSEVGLSSATAVKVVGLLKKHLRDGDEPVSADGQRDAKSDAKLEETLRRNIATLRSIQNGR